MNPTFSRIGAVSALVVLMAVLQACKTSEPGVSSNYMHQYTTVAASPPQATAAAQQALRSLDLKKVSGQSTQLEGSARGYLADGSKVNVSVEPKGQNASSVTVSVGTFGSPDLGKRIVAAIQKRVKRMNGMNQNQQGMNPNRQGMNQNQQGMNRRQMNNGGRMYRQNTNNAQGMNSRGVNGQGMNNRRGMNTQGVNGQGMNNANDSQMNGPNSNGMNDTGTTQ